MDPLINVARVEARVASGGHDVEKSTIISRYHKSIGNIKILMKLCDILHVYDNSLEPIRIIRKHKEDISVFPNDLWSETELLKMIGEWNDLINKS